MTIEDVNQEELKRAFANARVHKLSYLDSELGADPELVTVAFCHLDDNSWMSAISSPALANNMLMTWSTGPRCTPMKEARYEKDAFIQEVFRATSAHKQNQARLIIIPVSLTLQKPASPGKDKPNIWRGKSESTTKLEMAKVIAEQITTNEVVMELLREKLPSISEPFDPFEL